MSTASASRTKTAAPAEPVVHEPISAEAMRTIIGDRPFHRNPLVGGILAAAGLDFEVAKRPIAAQFNAGWHGTPLKSALMRVDRVNEGDQAETGLMHPEPLAIVSPQYQPVGNRDAFGIFEPLIVNGQVTNMQAQQNDDASVVWMSGSVGTQQHPVLGAVKSGLVVVAGHDGSHGVQAQAEVSFNGNTVGIPLEKRAHMHRGDATERVEAASKLHADAVAKIHAATETLSAMRSSETPRNAFRSVVVGLFVGNPKEAWRPIEIERYQRAMKAAGIDASVSAADDPMGDVDGPSRLKAFTACLAVINAMRGSDTPIGRKHDLRLQAFTQLQPPAPT